MSQNNIILVAFYAVVDLRISVQQVISLTHSTYYSFRYIIIFSVLLTFLLVKEKHNGHNSKERSMLITSAVK